MLQTKAIMIYCLWDLEINFEGTLLGKVVGLQQNYQSRSLVRQVYG
jgi:hypothetical protein